MNNKNRTYDEIITSAKQLFDKEKLPFPTIPEQMESSFQKAGNNLFGTLIPENGVYALETFVTNLRQSENTEDYLITGIDGHGIASQAFHYYIVNGPLAIFLQLSWGNPLVDQEQARQKIEGALAFVDYLLKDMETACQTRKVPEDKRLVVIHSDFSNSRWSWTPLQPHDEKTVQWHKHPMVMLAAHLSLESIIQKV